MNDSVANRTPGQNLVPFVFFTNKYEETIGVKTYHSMMGIVSYGNKACPIGLKDVPRPPGASANTCSSHTRTPVMRISNLKNCVLTMPMKDYESITITAELQTDASSFKSICSGDATNKLSAINRMFYKYANASNNGILINGKVMSLRYKNALYPSPTAGELSPSNYHISQDDGGPLSHSNAYQSGRGLGTYNDADCSGKTHPLLISALLAAPNSASTNIWVEQ